MICYRVCCKTNMLELTVSLTSLSHPLSFTTFSRSSYSTHSLFIPSPTHSPHFLVPFTHHILSSLSSSFSHPTHTLSSHSHQPPPVTHLTISTLFIQHFYSPLSLLPPLLTHLIIQPIILTKLSQQSLPFLAQLSHSPQSPDTNSPSHLQHSLPHSHASFLSLFLFIHFSLAVSFHPTRPIIYPFHWILSKQSRHSIHLSFISSCSPPSLNFTHPLTRLSHSPHYLLIISHPLTSHLPFDLLHSRRSH